MHKRQDGWNIVLAGFWNRMIFTPEWVGPRLFGDNAQLETVVALLPILPIIYRDHQVAVEIATSRIICRARNLDNEASLRRSAEMAGLILRALPETPVQGVGVNFSYREDAPEAMLLDLFNLADNTRWVEAGWELGERKLIRQLNRDGETLNLTLSLKSDGLDIDCNFHTAPEDNPAAIAAVSAERVITLRDWTLQTLQDLYGLELEENANDA